MKGHIGVENLARHALAVAWRLSARRANRACVVRCKVCGVLVPRGEGRAASFGGVATGSTSAFLCASCVLVIEEAQTWLAAETAARRGPIPEES